jgi:hypothetical protein
MKLFFTALIATGLAFGAIAATGKSPETATDPVFTRVARANGGEGGERYHLRSVDNLSCEVARSAAAADGVYTMRAGSECDRLLPGLSAARFWRERDGGLIVLGRNLADDLISFAVADGIAYESVRPASALISMTAVD